MSFIVSTTGRAALALVVIGIAGCGESSDGVPIHGHVSYRGEAITSGVLTFFPVSGRPISATLSHAAEYTIQALPGKYRVIVTIGVDLPVGWKEGDLVPSPEFVLPNQYTVRAKSSLKTTVTENQKTPVDFALE